MTIFPQVTKLGLGSTVIGLALVALAPAANALSFTFGYEIGEGKVTGYFSGEDVNSDQFLTTEEVYTFDLFWSGNDDTNANHWVSGDLESFFASVEGALLDFTVRDKFNLLDYQTVTISAPTPSISAFTVITDFNNLNVYAHSLITATPEPSTDIPTPAAVLPNLFGMGLSALRKRKGNV